MRRAETLKGRSEEELPGVFVPTTQGLFVGPRAGWVLLLLVGVVALAVAVGAAFFAPDQPRTRLPQASGLVAGTAALGLLCLMAGVVRFRRAEPEGPVGNFVFADSGRLWVVGDSTVQVCEYANDLTATGQHYFQNGAYQHTQIVVRSAAGIQVLHVTQRTRSERLLQFLNAMGHLRQLDTSTFRDLAAIGSARIGLVALCILDDRPLDSVSFDSLTDPPYPRAEPTGDAGPGWGGAVVRVVAAGVLGVGLFFGLTPTFDWLREAKLFAAVEADPSPSVAAMDRYLGEYPSDRRGPTVRQMRDERVFGLIPKPIVGAETELYAIERYLHEHPDGSHAAEVRDLRDDHLFAVAEHTATAEDSPAGLRKYLAVPTNTRHRAAAVARIGGYYDRTVAELKKRAAENPGKIDAALMDPLTTLIASLKGVDDPVVTVGFVSELQTDPKTDAEKELEKFVYDLRMKDQPRLKDVVARSATNSAILPYLQAFEPEQVSNREKVIYERMADAVQKAIKADILTLRPARSGEQPMIEVRYKILPSGSLYLYTATNEIGTETVKGLLRGYSLKWEILIRPPGAAEPLKYTVASQPLHTLNYDSNPSDPEWAPYAIILYSAFYDLSDRMIRAFALDPGKPPNAFTFSATASTKADKPDPLGGFRPPTTPKWKINPKTGNLEFDK